jgi:hypothetical protein
MVGRAGSLSLILDVYQFHYLSISFVIKKINKKARETYCLNLDKHEKLPPIDVSPKTVVCLWNRVYQ